jgi:arabinan endo-1,5-alpha-L-arabinosidase
LICFNLLLFYRRLVLTVAMRSSFITSLLSVVTAVYGYADPMGCSGVCTNAHDPALIRRDDGTYYRFSTGGKIAIHTAPTIVGPWTYKGAAIPAGSVININGKNDLWVSHMMRLVSLREQAD